MPARGVRRSVSLNDVTFQPSPMSLPVFDGFHQLVSGRVFDRELDAFRFDRDNDRSKGKRNWG